MSIMKLDNPSTPYLLQTLPWELKDKIASFLLPADMICLREAARIFRDAPSQCAPVPDDKRQTVQDLAVFMNRRGGCMVVVVANTAMREVSDLLSNYICPRMFSSWKPCRNIKPEPICALGFDYHLTRLTDLSVHCPVPIEILTACNGLRYLLTNLSDIAVAKQNTGYIEALPVERWREVHVVFNGEVTFLKGVAERWENYGSCKRDHRSELTYDQHSDSSRGWDTAGGVNEPHTHDWGPAGFYQLQSRPGEGARAYAIMTTFPTRDLVEMGSTLKEAGLMSL
ncbi:hypothetical protein BC830DRAFT_1229153 [Chytriomyces sp. MP71]|nr:hypothetical protein BC830DRAFT_1229153 [Chytriomyces sp. MP71]